MSPGGQTILKHRRGGTNVFASKGEGGQTFLLWGGKTFFVVGGGGYDDVDEEMDVSKGNFLASAKRERWRVHASELRDIAMSKNGKRLYREGAW